MKLLAALLLATSVSLHASPRFGINAAGQIPANELAELGVGRVRFENLKWPMVSPAPGEFAYDGSVAPWHVDVDKILADYTAAGIDVLPFLFQTAAYASTAPEGTKPSQVYSYPPKNDADYAEFVWQTVARYGSKKHPPELLKTADKKSGLGLLKTVELWNEPNLNAPEWGPWVADMPRYFQLFRAGAEAAKRADPTIKVSHGGFAGIDIDTVDQLASHRYPDGKTPLDFTDIINVHYYSGKVRPERATTDPNVDRSGTDDGPKPADWAAETRGPRPGWYTDSRPAPGSYEGTLRRLSSWRDQFAKEKPIWLTETGYDTAGPYAITEEEQAARLPRVIMLALAAGVESVFVYREKGSAPGQHAASGLLRDDGTKKPAWETYRTMIAKLGGTGQGRRIGTNNGERSILWSSDGRYVLSEWAVEGTGVGKILFASGSRIDAFGEPTTPGLTELPNYGAMHIKEMTYEEKAHLADEKPGARFAFQNHEADLKRTTHLFDFGGTAKRKTLYLGKHRRFTPVTADQTFTPERGHGFEPNPAMQNGFRKWIRDFADCDDCRLNKDIAFRFTVDSGRYTLRAGASALSDKAVTVTLSQADKAIATLTFGKDTTAEATLELGAGEVLFQTGDYLDLRWLTLIESPPESP